MFTRSAVRAEQNEIVFSMRLRIYIQNVAVAEREHNNNSTAQFQRSNKLDFPWLSQKYYIQQFQKWQAHLIKLSTLDTCASNTSYGCCTKMLQHC